MKAANPDLRLDSEPVATAEIPRLAQAILAADDREKAARRPRRRVPFDFRPLHGGVIKARDEGLRIFRVR